MINQNSILLPMVCILSLFLLGAFTFSVARNFENNAECEKAGGIWVKSHNGPICIKKEVVIKL